MLKTCHLPKKYTSNLIGQTALLLLLLNVLLYKKNHVIKRCLFDFCLFKRPKCTNVERKRWLQMHAAGNGPIKFSVVLISRWDELHNVSRKSHRCGLVANRNMSLTNRGRQTSKTEMRDSDRVRSPHQRRRTNCAATLLPTPTVL